MKGRSRRIPGRRRHDMRDAVPSCGTIGGAGRRAGARGNCRHTRRRTLVPARRSGGSPTALIRARRRRGASAVIRVGLLGRLGAGVCPNLLQRRPGPGSAARRSAEYQRFSSGAPARSGPLQQIRTTCAATALEEGIREPDGDHDGCTDGRAGPAERSPAREDTLRSRPGGADRP